MLKIENLTFAYRRKHPVVENLSLDLMPGGVYGLLGPNGAGKSTLLYLIVGALTPASGKVMYKDVDTRLRLPSTLNDIFIVPEEFTLPSVKLSTYVNANACFYPNFSADDLRHHLETFDMTPDLHLGALSMGQKKKAFMSFALACNTSLIVMDEPTNGLDIPGKSAFRRFIASSMTDDRTILISTHQVRDIDRLIDHVIIMNRSNVVVNSSVNRILEQLAFFNTDDRELISRALYAQPSLEGAAIILPNESGAETEINLETLFELALSQPDKLKSILSIPTNS